MKGTIARWFQYSGYGFIDVEAQNNDIFVHTSHVNNYSNPRVGDEVEFDIRDTYKGPRAVNVEIV